MKEKRNIFGEIMGSFALLAIAVGAFQSFGNWLNDIINPETQVQAVSEVVIVPDEEEYLSWLKEQPLRSYVFSTNFVCPFDPGNSVYLPLGENGDNVEYRMLETHTPVCNEAYDIWLSNRQRIICTDHPQNCIYTRYYQAEDDYLNGTATCRDGTISYSRHRQGTCSWHGGVALWH